MWYCSAYARIIKAKYLTFLKLQNELSSRKFILLIVWIDCCKASEKWVDVRCHANCWTVKLQCRLVFKSPNLSIIFQWHTQTIHSIFNCIIELWQCSVIKFKLYKFAAEHAGMKLAKIGVHTKVHKKICKKCGIYVTNEISTDSKHCDAPWRLFDCSFARSPALVRKRNNRLHSRPESMFNSHFSDKTNHWALHEAECIRII